MFVCWPHSSPGNVSVPCPSYLPWISEGDIFIKLFSFYSLLKNIPVLKFPEGKSLMEENMHINVWFDHLQMTPGGHTENVWEPGSGGKSRTPPNPGGMILNARRTIILRTR